EGGPSPTAFTPRVFALDFQQDGRIIAGGKELTLLSLGLVRLSATGEADTNYVRNSSIIFAVTIQDDGDILIGGDGPTILRRMVGERLSGAPMVRKEPWDQTCV